MKLLNILTLIIGIYSVKAFNPFQLSINKYNIGNIRVIESENKKSEALFLPGKITNIIPSEAYNNFLMHLSNNNIKIYVPDKEENKILGLVNKITENNSELVVIAHSTSCSKAIEIANKSNNIRNIILIDPIDFESLEIKNKIENLKKSSIQKTLQFSNQIYQNIPIKIELKDNFKNLNKDVKLLVPSDKKTELDIDNILIIKSKLSEKWKYMPFIPPIGLYYLDTGKYNFKNTNITVKEFENFGHFDIIDSPWSDILHSTVSKGNKDRNNFKIQNHQQLLAKIVSGFANKKNRITEIVIKD